MANEVDDQRAARTVGPVVYARLTLALALAGYATHVSPLCEHMRRGGAGLDLSALPCSPATLEIR